ncbi:hypothetical protein [Salinimicrobium terrae]|uniref:hypothetical protein n=1 Tax=Salinimicrobium terrae TaxID=470866 RepID=UPI00040F7BF0|nr:hypothetical protein [Salinimicrobium terrae]
MKKIPFLILAGFLLLFTSCGNTKYHYHFEKGRMIDFSEGEWILNRPYTNYNEERIKKVALKGFKKVLGDSLVSIDDLSQRKEVPKYMPQDPSTEQLQYLQKATGMDFLITVESNMIKNEMGSFAHAPSVGFSTQTNEAGISIKIYDLNSQELLSESNVAAIAKVTKSEDDNSWDYVNNAETLSMQGVKKLIKKYRRYGITE